MQATIENTRRRGVVTPYHFTQEEFLKEIRNAEKGPFISLDELDSRLEYFIRQAATEK